MILLLKKKIIRGWSDRPSKLRHRGSAKILGIAVHKPLQKRPDHSNLVSKGSNSIAKTWILNLNRKDEASNPRTHKLHQVYIPLALVLLMQCQCHLFVKIYVSTLSTSNKDVDHSICHYWQAYKVERWRWYRNVSVFFFLKGRLFLMFSHSGLLSILLGPDPSTTLSAALDPLSKVQCNHHLVSFQDILDEEYISLSLAIINYINQNLKD